MTTFTVKGIQFFDDPQGHECDSTLRIYSDSRFRELCWHSSNVAEDTNSFDLVGYYRNRPLRGGFSTCDVRKPKIIGASNKGVPRLRSVLTSPQCDRVLQVIKHLEWRGYRSFSAACSKNEFLDSFIEPRTQTIECEWESGGGTLGGMAAIFIESKKHFSTAEAQLSRSANDNGHDTELSYWQFIYYLRHSGKFHIERFIENANQPFPSVESHYLRKINTSDSLELGGIVT